MKIYTRTGDKGMTSLLGGVKVSKDDLRIEAYGTVDELNAYVGLIGAAMEDGHTKSFLKTIQENLFVIGSYLATDGSKPGLRIPEFEAENVLKLESGIDRLEKGLPVLKTFILPGGSINSSFCHIARCVCRRAERQVVRLAKKVDVDGFIIRYLNRLSDFLFVLCREINKNEGTEEVIWKPLN